MWARGGIRASVDRHLLDARAGLPPRLAAAYDRLLAERALPGPDPDAYFGALGHPLFELPVWVGARLREGGAHVGDADLDAALGVSALGYLHVRAQDDWLDGDRAGPGAVARVALGEALLARCTGLLARIVAGSPVFWRRYGDVMGAYAEYLLQVEEVRGSEAIVTRTDFEALLAQSRPLAVPSLALLDRAGRWDLAPGLEEFVLATTGASQLFNDLTDVEVDRAAGQRTYTSDSLDAAGEPLWLGLVGPGPGAGAFGARVREAVTFHDRAAAAARDLGLAGAAPWLAERRAALEGLPAQLSRHLVETFTEQLAGADGHDRRARPTPKEAAS